MKRLLILTMILVLTIALSGCAAISNEMKDIESDLVGLDRTCEVWQDGQVIKSYEDTINIEPTEYGNKVIMYLEDADKRVAIYNAVVICEEE